MKYKSKVSLTFALAVMIFTVIPIATSVLSIYYEIILIPLTALFIVIDTIFLYPIWMNTGYIFNDEYFRVYSGIFVKIDIPYKDIISYGKADTDFSPTSLSKKGIIIYYNNERGIKTRVSVSPQYIGFFLDEMRKNTSLDATEYPVMRSFRLSKGV